MKIQLSVISGPHQGREFEFDGRDTFLVGRSKDAHFQLPADDPFFSRRHFLLELNPPRCRLTDLNSRNGTRLNGKPVQSAEVADGDQISAGHTTFGVRVISDDPDRVPTLRMAAPATEAAVATTDYRPPVVVPGYRVEGELGRGGMGVVYRARRERDGLAVALKIAKPDVAADRRDIDRFLRECRILATLDHPNIIAFRDAGEAGGIVYLAMDLVEGSDLGVWLADSGSGDVRTAVRIMCQMLKGLAHAHEQGFVHRDIKPGNILIGQEGAKKKAMLADFGLARAFEASRISGLTMQGEVGGTPAFMAPEQVTHYRDVKPTADQYSAAATLYRMLTGQNVFDMPKDIASQIALLVTADPVPITQRRADVPAALAAVIHRALSREPGERYPDVAAFRKELKRFA